MTDIATIRSDIWELSGKDPDLIQKAKASIVAPPDTILYWQQVQLQVAILVAGKPKRRRIKRADTTPPELIARYRKAYDDYQARKFPNWVKDGHALQATWPDVTTSGGLQDMIITFLTWTGHFANRTSNEGRVIIKDGKPIRIPSSQRNGMQDIDTNLKHPAHEYGIPWKIEIKVGADTHKDHQKDYGKLVQQTGGVYSVVRDAVDFFSQLDRLLVVQKELFS